MAMADFGIISDCEMQLSISSVKITDQNGNDVVDDSFIERIQSPLRFEWNDGLISEICSTNDDDSQWSLNFKRSLLSALQNSMDSLYDPEPVREIDAAGDCWANYQVNDWYECMPSNRAGTCVDFTKRDQLPTDGNITISWTKDLNHCADRHGGLTSLFGVRYSNPMSDINTLPLTSGEQNCQQLIGNGIIQLAECVETLDFMAGEIQNGASSVVSEASMRLKLNAVSTNQQIQTKKFVKSSDLLFDHTYVVAKIDGQATEAEAVMKKMCNDDGIASDSGRELSDFVDILRSLSSSELSSIYEEAKKCQAVL